MYYLCNALHYCKKKVRVILGPLEENNIPQKFRDDYYIR